MELPQIWVQRVQEQREARKWKPSAVRAVGGRPAPAGFRDRLALRARLRQLTCWHRWERAWMLDASGVYGTDALACRKCGTRIPARS